MFGISNPFNRFMDDPAMRGGQPQMAAQQQKAPQQGMPQQRGGMSRGDLIALALGGLRDGMNGGQSQSLNTALQMMMARRQAEQEAMAAQQAQMQAQQQAQNTEQRAGKVNNQRFSDLTAMGFSEQEARIMMENPEAMGSQMAQRAAPQSMAPGVRVEQRGGPTMQGGPRYYPVQPGGRLVLDPSYNGVAPSGDSPPILTDEDILRMGGGGNPAGNFPGGAPGRFR